VSAPPAASASTSVPPRPSSRRNHTQELFEKLADKSLVKVAQFAPPSGRPFGEAFGLTPGRNMEGQLVATLRHLGFDYVFDTQFSADLTIMEEASELLERLQSGGPLPLITSCSSAWMKYMEQFYPDFIENISTCKSPMSMASSLFKTYWADKMKLDPKKILSVAVMCCTAKKFEAARPELEVHGLRTTDIVVTTREMGWMIKSAGIDFVNIRRRNLTSRWACLPGGHDLWCHRRCHGGGHPYRVRTLHGGDARRHRGQ